jgi:hypothetical protein
MHSEYQAETYFFLGKTPLPDDPGATPDDKKEDRANSGFKTADVHDDALRGETERTAS